MIKISSDFFILFSFLSLNCAKIEDLCVNRTRYYNFLYTYKHNCHNFLIQANYRLIQILKKTSFSHLYKQIDKNKAGCDLY